MIYPRLDAQDIMEITKTKYAIANKVSEILNRETAAGKNPEEVMEDEILKKLTKKQREDIIEWMESRRKYLGQMDLNIKSPLVWKFYDDTLQTLASYGAKIVRLDAFAYAPKEPGENNFLNEPGTWNLLEKLKIMADKYQLILLPEIHADYDKKIYEVIAQKGYMTYDFFLPGLIIDALERKCGDELEKWAKELLEKKIYTVNMLGCHDGIPLLDLKGLLSEERIQDIIEIVVARGGIVKDLHGQKNIYYQINSTYYSALGENDEKMLMARALQLFMPGKPQIWYLDLFAGKNDYKAVRCAGEGGHKEINRSNLSWKEIEDKMKTNVVRKQLEMLKFRSTCPAFSRESKITVENKDTGMHFTWEYDGYVAELDANLKEMTYEISSTDPVGKKYIL